MSETIEEVREASAAREETGPVEVPGPSKAEPEPMSDAHLRSVIESLVFVADAPVSPLRLSRHAKVKSAEVKKALVALSETYAGRGIELVEVGSGWQFRSSASNASFVRNFVAQKPVRLTRAQLETMSIIGYRQPVTRPEIDDIRGVDCGSSLKVLLERGLIKILGRKEEPGRPLLYGTTAYFLEFFGLRSLGDLPTLREFSELSDESRAFFEKKIGEEFDPDELEAMRKAQKDAAALALAADSDEEERREDAQEDVRAADGDDEDGDGDDEDGDDEDEDGDDEDEG